MKIAKIKYILKRLNQVILSFPIWIILGLSGLLLDGKNDGWKKSKPKCRPDKMY